jgi:hypothetical protein
MDPARSLGRERDGVGRGHTGMLREKIPRTAAAATQ